VGGALSETAIRPSVRLSVTHTHLYSAKNRENESEALSVHLSHGAAA